MEIAKGKTLFKDFVLHITTLNLGFSLVDIDEFV